MESIICDLCRSATFSLRPQETTALRLPDPYTIVRCDNCQLMYMNPRMTAEEYREFYDSKYYDDYEYDTILSEERNPKFLQRLATFRQLKPARGRLLDIGTATGEFLHTAKQDGWEVWGTEVSSFAAQQAKRLYGLDIFVGEVDDAPYAEKSFDIIHLSHVLEHVPSPRGTLRSITRLLKDDGYLVIEIPYQFGNWFDRLAQRFGRSHITKEPSLHHVYFYTPRSLGMIFDSENFSSHVRTYSLDTPYAKKRSWQKPIWWAATRIVDHLGGGLYIEAYARKKPRVTS